MTGYTTISVASRKYEDEDNCLAACEADIAAQRGLEDWQVSNARWEDDANRETILVDVPAEEA